MSELQPLMALLEQAERERDEAQRRRQQAQAQAHAAQEQSEQLLAYRRDYEQRWGARFSAEGQMELVHCYQGFVGRLTQAVDHQARVARQAATQAERALQTLQEQELRVASVRKLIERRMLEMRQRGQRIEQRQNDEIASRAAWNRLAAATTRF
ncbi:MAG: flagellar export protein FliJ [Piscinibacter sp.]|nr:flagellar export protein FliJ [Piscinibacter sp.]